ncbi:MAG: TonB-dependent receptor [Bacteroidales bacterium]|nr:TonB-dependent receptor [Bacteroidales bacterium]
MNLRHYTQLVLIFCLSISSFSQADTNLPALDVLEGKDLVPFLDTSEIKVITASRTSKNLSDLPVTIHIITHEEIILKQYTSLTDILKMMPGIRVSQPGSGESGDYFEVRALTGNFYTKILLNGVPIKPSVVKGMPIGAQLPVRQAERIEIIYGPAAAIYGADAIAGVINIITKESDQGTFVRADISLGENEYNSFNFTIGGKAGKNNNILKYTFYGSKTEFNDVNIKYDKENFYNPLNSFDSVIIQGRRYLSGDVINRTVSVPDETSFMRENYGPNYEGSVFAPDMEELPSSSYMTGIDLNFKGIRVTYNNMYRRSHSSVGHSTARYKYNNPQNYWGEIIQLLSASYEKTRKRFSSFTQVSSLRYHMDNNSSLGLTYLYNTDKVYLYSESNDLLLEQLFTVAPTDKIEITSGLSYQKSLYLPLTNFLSEPFNKKDYYPVRNEVDYTDPVFSYGKYYPGAFTNLSGFTQAYVNHNKYRFMGGFRYDYNSRYGNKINPRMGVLYKIFTRSSIRLMAGLAYKSPPPSLEYESIIYPVNNPDSIYYYRVPGTSLEPEKFQSLEIGINTSPFWDIQVDVATYYNHIYNLFDNTITMPIPDYENAINDSACSIRNENTFWRVYGIQTNVKKKNIIPSIKMDVELNLTFSYFSQNLPTLDTILGYFRLVPKHFGQLSLSCYPTKKLYVSIENVWESNWLRNLLLIEDVYNYLFKNTGGYFTLNTLVSYKVGQNIRCFVKVINLLDEHYSGLNDTGQTIDQLYNPQLGRNIRIGLSYSFN